MTTQPITKKSLGVSTHWDALLTGPVKPTSRLMAESSVWLSYMVVPPYSIVLGLPGRAADKKAVRQLLNLSGLPYVLSAPSGK